MIANDMTQTGLLNSVSTWLMMEMLAMPRLMMPHPAFLRTDSITAGLFLTETPRRTTFSATGLDGFTSMTPSINPHEMPRLDRLRFT
jgi:hypothetical protein